MVLLRRDASASALIVLVLGLGIGGNTAIFTLLKGAFSIRHSGEKHGLGPEQLGIFFAGCARRHRTLDGGRSGSGLTASLEKRNRVACFQQRDCRGGEDVRRGAAVLRLRDGDSGLGTIGPRQSTRSRGGSARGVRFGQFSCGRLWIVSNCRRWTEGKW